jgi:PHD/YefM family antitoxin component YafN of YafNO toxin-antitoxin module
MTIAANELKTKGISAIDTLLKDESEAIITVRGEQKYVVLDMKRYNFLRECELEAALMEARQELKDGRFIVESVDEHLQRITDEI